MKTYIYYSKSNKAVEAVVAYNRASADEFLLKKLTIMSVVIKDDYSLMATVDCGKEYSTSGFDIE